MALTATASCETQSAIQESLKLVRPVVVSLNLNRPNVYLSVSTIQSLWVSIVDIGVHLQSLAFLCPLERFSWSHNHA